MSETTTVPTKAAKCVICQKDIQIGKFASAKTATCEEHAAQKPPVAPKPPKAAPVVAPAAEADPFAAAAAAENEGGTATASPVIAPAASEQKEAPKPKKEDANTAKVPQEIKDAFNALLGKPVSKDTEKVEKAGFVVSPHGVLYIIMPDGAMICFIEINRKCLGVSRTINKTTEPVFDVSNLHKFSPEEQAVILKYRDQVA